ncbi:MAG: hypothetical protein KKI02_12535, partial [Planctomycetes bacterium]|nr:hypothetical protein [Planctomycetota bacterium]
LVPLGTALSTSTPEQPESLATADDDSLVTRARRFTGYLFWHSVGLMLPLALDRLIICPVLNEQLGKELFGSFVWVLGIMSLFGNIAANGFAILLMRSLAHSPLDTARLMVRTALLLSGMFSCLILALASFGSYVIADEVVRANALALYIPLAVFALMRSFQLIVLANLRITRRFASLFALKLVEASVLLSILLVAPGKSLPLIGTLYLVSIVLSLPVGVASSRHLIGTGRWWSSQTAKWLITGWFAGALLTVLDQTQVYASRIIVGALSGGAQVAVLYAGTSIGNLFCAPAGILGSLVLSLLAGKKTFVLTGRRGHLYLLFVSGLAVSIGIVSFLVGRVLVGLLYPLLAPETLSFYHWIAVANGCVCVMVLARPVAVKYGTMSSVALLSAITLTLQLGALVVMVPLAQARGAAISFAASSSLAALLWLLYFNRLRRRAEQDDSNLVEAHV